MYHMSDRSLKTLREEILESRDAHAKFVAGMKRRQGSARRRNDRSEDQFNLQQFKLGLANEYVRADMRSSRSQLLPSPLALVI